MSSSGQNRTGSASGSLPAVNGTGGGQANGTAQSQMGRASSHNAIGRQQNVVIDIESEDLTYNQARSIRL